MTRRAAGGSAGRAGLLSAHASQPAALRDVPLLPIERFREACLGLRRDGGRLVLLSPLPAKDRGRDLFAVFADDPGGSLSILRGRLPRDGRYPSLTPDLPAAQGFEREILEEGGAHPEGHPWAKPLRSRGDGFFAVEGQGVHEVAVGPVHAGIIEPGHFRFQCHGETVLHLEIRLGYQHRGAEALLLKSAPGRRIAVAESIAGDTAVGHSLAHCMAIEALSGVEPPLAAQALRGILLELERLANHAGDLGALCNDVGFLPGASWFGRLRGDFLNMLLEVTGNRFGRGGLVPGGVRAGLTGAQRKDLGARLARAERDVENVGALVFGDSSVQSRFERTGVLTPRAGADLGMVGPAARASGWTGDARTDHPAGIYRYAHIPVASVNEGDVMARALIRWIEAQRSIVFVREQLEEFQGGDLRTGVPPPRPGRMAVAIVEGWRGAITHAAASGEGGCLAFYRVVDPSFVNWFGLAMAMRGGEISDFPLCNKSFNLSYAGHDL